MDKIIYKGIFGSKLYGTSTPSSDNDFKQIHQASIESIVLGKSVDNINMSTNPKVRNTSDDIDFESKELRQFIKDSLGGQTYAFDMLFTPKKLWEYSTSTWRDLISHRDKLLTNNITPFIGYCRSQSMKYSLKGEKLNTLMLLRDKILSNIDYAKMTVSLFFEKNPELTKLKYVRKYTKKLVSASSTKDEVYYDIVLTSTPGERQIAEVLPSINLQIKNYGTRSKEAMDNQGIDLKAYYHALRICWELEQYLTTGEIVFPCPKRDILLKVRLGEFSKDYVEHFIEDEIERVLKIENTLPNADYVYWDNWILNRYVSSHKYKLQK
jgi:predicted nucleotidyltransferase